jgi:hypothetical protein
MDYPDLMMDVDAYAATIRAHQHALTLAQARAVVVANVRQSETVFVLEALDSLKATP